MTERPGNRETENENLRPDGDGHAPRPANEPAGWKGSVQTEKTVTDPGSGEGDHAEHGGGVAPATDVAPLKTPLLKSARRPLRPRSARPPPPRCAPGRTVSEPASLNAAPVFLALT